MSTSCACRTVRDHVFVPLVDILRCTRPHADTWLVASIDRADGRYIVDGTLGCPTCLAEYPIRNGIAFFSAPRHYAAHVQPDETSAVRLAAALDLTDARMTAVLHGSWGVHAQLIVGVSPSQLLLLNPPDEVVMTDGVSAIVSDAAPLAAGSVSAAAIDKPITPTLLTSLRRSLRHGGRLLGTNSGRCARWVHRAGPRHRGLGRAARCHDHGECANSANAARRPAGASFARLGVRHIGVVTVRVQLVDEGLVGLVHHTAFDFQRWRELATFD